ncbi:MAG: tetratricopeptide repeat protein [Thermoguttaceae bacterium]
MKTIRVFLASSEELKSDRNEFSDLVLQLNDLFERRQIQIKLKRWEHLDASMGTSHKQEEYNNVIRECEMAMVLFWTKFGDYTKDEFETAYNELKAGRNPQKIYVFFKDAVPEEMHEELKNFRGSFDTAYGHFYGKFSNVDTMRLQFLLQLELYLKNREPLLTVKDGYVKINEQKLVELKNVPFAALNKDYQRMTAEIVELNDEIAELKQECKESPENDKKKSRLLQKQMRREDAQKELEQFEQLMFDTAKKVAELSGQYCNELTLRAMRLLEEGKVSEAVAVLDAETLTRDTERNLQNYRRSQEETEIWRKNVEADINAFLLRAKSLQVDMSFHGEERYKSVCEAYEKALQAAREIDYDLAELAGEIIFPYASWCQKWNLFAEALPLHTEALSIRRELAAKEPRVHLPHVAIALNNLGNLQSDTGCYPEAEASYAEALKIRRELAAKEPGAHLPKFAETLNSLGVLQSDTGRKTEAEAFCTEALGIYRELAAKEPGAYLPEVAKILSNLGALQSDTGRKTEAEVLYTEALSIRRELAAKEPGVYLPNVATTLNNLGNLQSDTGRYPEAEASYTEALSIRRELAAKEPGVYLPNVATTLNNLGVLQSDAGRNTEAEASYTEALSIRRELAAKEPGAYLPKMADTLNNLGVLQSDAGRNTEAEASYTEALSIRRELAVKEPGAYLPDVATTLNNLGVLQSDAGRNTEAEASYTEAFAIRMELAVKEPGVYLPDLASTLFLLGILQIKTDRETESQKFLAEAFDIAKRFPQNAKCQRIVAVLSE